jgi:hypothetical protein
MRAVPFLALLFVCTHSYPFFANTREEPGVIDVPLVDTQEEPPDDWYDPIANSSDWWDEPDNNLTNWWDEPDNSTNPWDNQPATNLSFPPFANATIVPVALSFFQSFLDLFATHNESSTGYIFITYIQMIPMIQCPEIDRVVQLFNSKIGEANPLADLASKALEYAGKPCNATACTCDTDSRRKLAFKTLKVETRSNVHKLRPAAKFPLSYETVSIM